MIQEIGSAGWVIPDLAFFIFSCYMYQRDKKDKLNLFFAVIWAVFLIIDGTACINYLRQL
jgi:hypothetical protein